MALTPVAWCTERELDPHEWAESGKRLGVVGRNAKWWIGDWVRYGNTRWGERYSRAAKITGYDPQTLMNMVYVASRFDPPRRRDALSWSHHAALAALEAADQERLLTQAAAERMSVHDLRAVIRGERRMRQQLDDGHVPRALIGSGTRSPTVDTQPGTCPHCGHAVADG